MAKGEIAYHAHFFLYLRSFQIPLLQRYQTFKPHQIKWNITLRVVNIMPSSPYSRWLSMRSSINVISAPRWCIRERITTNWNMGNKSSIHHMWSSLMKSWTVWKMKIILSLNLFHCFTLSHIQTLSDASAADNFWKHYCKMNKSAMCERQSSSVFL